MSIEVSDWVQGKTVHGEFFFGYVEQVDEPKGLVKVNVVKSDNEEAIGKATVVRDAWLKKLPEPSVHSDAASIRNLIDLALSTWDEAWFMELTEQLKTALVDDTYKQRNDREHENRISAII
ncbi:IDEAL domain-containing protein [Paenibacillus sp. NEAU-GSW1]|uniref:IDEAL domain-containing protein n=1 Tax=Paenibacillus sp. NEAU-GSW1 TaxID=2682486 RepID=UPI0012E22553|nr:IDEAL domain-containing protein [Paenibacillus sp. NEAU-GSW1]MUT67490.1 IDEAL domain-containing protein [Paenibacillus sp. NEAU-GSW1]